MWIDTTSSDLYENNTITSDTYTNGYYCDKEEEKYLDDDYEWMKEGWKKPYLILLNLLILKIITPRARSLIQFQSKYPKQ